MQVETSTAQTLLAYVREHLTQHETRDMGSKSTHHHIGCQREGETSAAMSSKSITRTASVTHEEDDEEEEEEEDAPERGAAARTDASARGAAGDGPSSAGRGQ